MLFTEGSRCDVNGHKRFGCMERRRAEKKRIEWIDCARGIAILLVIAGHGVDGFPRALIFSFHMPLFFILSGRTSRYSADSREWLEKTGMSARRLLVPAVIVYLMRTAVTLWQAPEFLFDLSYWRGFVSTFLFASGVDIEDSGIFGGVQIGAMGIPWFFFALFFGRTLYDYVHMKFSGKWLAALCTALSVAGVVLGNVQWMPFSLDIALAVMPFFYMGDFLRKVNLEKGTWKILMVSCCLWLITLMAEYPDWNQWTYLELAWRRYPLYPLCFVTAAAGSLFWCEVSILALKLRKTARPFLLLGKNSMYMLCVHMMDYLWQPFCYASGPAFFSLMKKIMVDVLIFLAVMAVANKMKKLTRGPE